MYACMCKCMYACMIVNVYVNECVVIVWKKMYTYMGTRVYIDVYVFV